MTDDIRDKTRAVFFATIMVMAVAFMTAVSRGRAAILAVVEENTADATDSSLEDTEHLKRAKWLLNNDTLTVSLDDAPSQSRGERLRAHDINSPPSVTSQHHTGGVDTRQVGRDTETPVYHESKKPISDQSNFHHLQSKTGVAQR